MITGTKDIESKKKKPRDPLPTDVVTEVVVQKERVFSEEEKARIKKYEEYLKIVNLSILVYKEDKVEATISSSTPGKIEGYGDVPDIQTFYVVIYFPEILLKNYKGKGHTIRDLFVKLSFGWHPDKECYKLISVDVTRSTYTRAEYQTKYIHSHVNSNITGKFNNCAVCFGNTLISIMRARLGYGVNMKDYEHFLFLLNNWLSYESTDTTPYYSITSIKETDTNTSYSRADITSEANRIFPLVLGSLEDINITKSIDIKSIISGKYIEILSNDNYISQAIKLYTKHLGVIRNGVFVYVDFTGEEASQVKKKIKAEIKGKNLIFKGKSFPLTVIFKEAKKPDNIDSKDLTPNPTLVHAVIQLLQTHVSPAYLLACSDYEK